MKLNLAVDNLTTLRWWVDASYGVHWDSKGHTGMMMSMGKGAPMSGSWKQKLNARSSTEAELIGIDDAIPNIMVAYYFIRAQGYDVTHNILYQDNKSTILLVTNGTKHINHRFFLIKDKVDRGEVVVEYKPTGEMWSDILTKHKQGKAFRHMRGMLMNIDEDYDDEAERKATHPELLPSENMDEQSQKMDAEVLGKAVALMSASKPLYRRAATRPSAQRRRGLPALANLPL